jgi:hypothetical protein
MKPLVHTESRIQRTQRNMLTVYENKGDRAPMVPTDRFDEKDRAEEDAKTQQKAEYVLTTISCNPILKTEIPN